MHRVYKKLKLSCRTNPIYFSPYTDTLYSRDQPDGRYPFIVATQAHLVADSLRDTSQIHKLAMSALGVKPNYLRRWERYILKILNLEEVTIVATPKREEKYSKCRIIERKPGRTKFLSQKQVGGRSDII